MVGVNFENFSVKWLGWISIPKTSSYTFYAKAEDGVQVKLNGEMIINKGISETRTWLDADNGFLMNYRRSGNARI